jgi:hypothetical protein
MIEQLLAHRETIPYAMALGAIILAASVGYVLGRQDPLVICSEYIVDIEQCQSAQREQALLLGECKAKAAGGAVLECDKRIKEEVEKALKNHKDILCDD